MDAIGDSERPTIAGRLLFSKAQLTRYFDRIGLPATHRVYSVATLSNEQKLSCAALLQKHHLVKIPFENLTMHYSWHRVVDVSPQHLFDKIVGGQNRGGYCMEVNTFFHAVLLSVGFKAYQVGARVSHGGRYTGLAHCATVVMIGDDKYMIDVGFGGNCPTAPLPLKSGAEHVHIAPATMRIVHESLPQYVNQDCKVWVYQVKIDEGSEWTTNYCFLDVEFTSEDIRGMNWSPWKSPTSFFTYSILMTRFTTDKEVGADVARDGPGSPDERAVADGELDGVIILNHDEIKWRRKGEAVLQSKLRSERDRLEAIGRYFGIRLAEQDERAILGMVSQLKSSEKDS